MRQVLTLLVLAISTSSWAVRYPVPIGLSPGAAYYGTQKCSSNNNIHHQFESNTFAIRGGGARKSSSVTSSTRGGSAMVANPTITASRLKLYNLLSGGVAGTIASCITNPLEVVKTQLQSSSAAVGELSQASGHPTDIAKKIFENDGVVGFFRGLRPTLVGIIPARSVYFFSYEQSKRLLGTFGVKEGGVPNALISGFSAGIASNTLTNPIWMIKTRCQLIADSSAGQKIYSGYRDACAAIYKEEGIGGFYKGIYASYWGCLEGATQFMIYEQLKSKLLIRQNLRRAELGLESSDRLPKLGYFVAAAIAKGTASILTYPHEVARTRLREQARDGIFKYTGMWQTIGTVAKEEGTKSLYSGMGVHLLKVVPNSAIMFLTYEVVNSYLSRFTVIDG
mmetsp:Transcript_14664/g.22619  ORF Transcript_14664/g.22619 Transcript_14664/m.22619 type:complete len:394 (-) Transcript_14664:272-1453(-)